MYNGNIIGKEDKYALVYNEESQEIVYIVEEEMGGYNRERKIETLLGAKINYTIIAEENNIKLGSRRKAMEIIKQESEVKIGDNISVNILCVLPKVIIVECFGEEVYIPARECSYGWIDDLRTFKNFEKGKNINAIVINNDPIKLSIKKAIDIEMWEDNFYKEQNEYVGKIISVNQKGIFVEFPFKKRIVLCYLVDWKKELMLGDSVIVRISRIDKQEKKTWGHIVGFVKSKN